MDDRVGQQLGNYQLIRLLGEGGFAEVYLGEHIHLGTHAAIKVLHTQLTSDDVDKFRTEARTIARLIHPHIVRVLEFGVERKTPFLVMDYAPSGTLRQRHPKGVQLPLTTIVSYVKQVADALQYAHDEKVIHRDIKPENMLLGRRNEILLSDFGIALVAQSSRYQSAQEMAGTMAYMAPEQIQGKPRLASDQYSLGIVIYEWLSGDRPFHGSLTELVGQHLSVPPPPLREKVSMISLDIEKAVLMALEKDPHKRFASIQDFATALEQAYQLAPSQQVVLPTEVTLPREPPLPSDGMVAISPRQPPLPTHVVTPPDQLSLPIEAVTPPSQSFPPTVAATPSHTLAVSPPSTRESVVSSSHQPSQRRLSRRAVLVGLAGLTVAGGGIAWLAFTQKPQASTPAFRPTAASIATATPSGPPLGTTYLTYRGHSDFIDAIAWSPDGKHIASGGGRNDGTVQVWDATTGGNVLTYHNYANTPNNLGWSPDSRYIVFVSNDTTVQVWNAVNGNSVYTYRGHSQSNYGAFSVAWSPDGKHIASAGAFDKTVQIWDATTGGNVLTYKGNSDTVWGLAWSPDSRLIASASQDDTVRVWNAVNGNSVYTYRGHSSLVAAVAWSPDGKRIASGGTRDGTVQVWDAATGDHIYTYSGHGDRVVAVAWSPNGKRIASCGGHYDQTDKTTSRRFIDPTVQVWQAS